jgi:Na+/H+ antiporter NhaD/arsenite permease-like protein
MHELSIYSGWLGIVFIVGYALITLEHTIKINKATTALLMAIICWVFLFATSLCPHETNLHCFLEHFGGVSQIVFFLIGAMAIVETVSINHGFNVISDYIEVGSKRKMLWVIGILTFFLSSILDNLTTTIVMVTLLCKLLPKGEDRLIIGAGVVIAANAGGAWTPIGDVTTTMLWIGGQLTTAHMIKVLFIPSVVCLVVSLLCLSLMLKGNFPPKKVAKEESLPYSKRIFFLGAATLAFVPIFKMVTGLPPFMGVLFGLGVMWVITDLLRNNHPNKKLLQVPHALSKIDIPSVLFFLGILLTVDALDAGNILDQMAIWLDTHVGNTVAITTLIGLASAIVDNVPLVAASMGMYDLAQHPVDSKFWDLMAYAAGTGGSILVIGSAAGVVYMGIETVDFFWYLRRISLPALMGFLAGIGAYLLFS